MNFPLGTILILYIAYRQTVMMLMKLLDPIGVDQRKRRCLKRRVYQNKVSHMHDPSHYVVLAL